MNEEIQAVRSRHRRLSPVLTIQRVFRGFLVRRALMLFRLSASIIQRAFRRHLARRYVIFTNLLYSFPKLIAQKQATPNTCIIAKSLPRLAGK